MNTENLICLNGDWKLYYAQEFGAKKVMPDQPDGLGLQPIQAKVPGNVEIDLVNAGIEQDPFYGTNLVNFRKYEFYSWWYEREFYIPKEFEGKTTILRFGGIDTYGTITLNGQRIGTTDNMFISHEFDITEYIKIDSVNTFCVHISSASNASRNKEISAWMGGVDAIMEPVVVRKPAHTFGWDILPRLVSAGIWRDVEIYTQNETHINDVYFATKTVDLEHASIFCHYSFDTDDATLEGFTVSINGRCDEHSFSVTSIALFNTGVVSFDISKPLLWWPKGYGNPNLYDVTFELCKDGVVVDTYMQRLGIRSVELERNYGTIKAMNFVFKINGVPIFVKGTNWVALDALHSRDNDKLEQAHEILCDLGCNMIRCWGGTVYENPKFYDLCDENGIMVWQDFAMACGFYSQNDEFCNTIDQEACKIIKLYRNHASLVVWCGDNEVDQMIKHMPANPMLRTNRITRETLLRSVQMHDPYRPYLPSSPFIPEEYAEIEVPEQHTWGPRDYFKGQYYKNSTASFISEIGYFGCVRVSTLKKYIPEDKLMDFESDEYRAHSTENLYDNRRPYNRTHMWRNQIIALFGTIPEKLEDIVLASQISQAEALKFFIEKTRIQKWETSGIMQWNMKDGWPQISNSLVDYYFNKKLSYHYLKRVMKPISVIMGECEAWKHQVFICNDTLEIKTVSYTIKTDDGTIVIKGKYTIPANDILEVPSVSAIPGIQKLYIIEYEVDNQKHANHHISGYIPMNFQQYKGWLDQIAQLPDNFDPIECYS